MVTTTCDFFRYEAGYAVRSSSSTKLGGGLRRLELAGARTSCALRAPAAGRATLRAKSNLDTCVRSTTSASATIYVEAAEP